MRILGWIFVPFVMIFKNWRQRAFWANAIGSIFAACVLSFYTLVVLVSITGGAFLADLPLDLKGVSAKDCPKGTVYSAWYGRCLTNAEWRALR